MEELYLKKPTIEDKQNVEELKKEFLESGEDSIVGAGGLEALEYEAWLESIARKSNPETCPANRVPCTQFLVYRKSDNRLVGLIQIRHYLNESLLMYGGHIGDSIRPSERGKGYATSQIALALEEAKKLGIDRVLITCKKENVASAKTIVKNGGVLENEVEENGHPKQRYWVDLKSTTLENEPHSCI